MLGDGTSKGSGSTAKVRCPCCQTIFERSIEELGTWRFCPACGTSLGTSQETITFADEPPTPPEPVSAALADPAASSPAPVSTAPDATETKAQPAQKKCPYCAELILEEAIKCRYCGEFLSVRPRETAQRDFHVPDFFRQRYLSEAIARAWNNLKSIHWTVGVTSSVIAVLGFALAIVGAVMLNMGLLCLGVFLATVAGLGAAIVYLGR